MRKAISPPPLRRRRHRRTPHAPKPKSFFFSSFLSVLFFFIFLGPSNSTPSNAITPPTLLRPIAGLTIGLLHLMRYLHSFSSSASLLPVTSGGGVGGGGSSSRSIETHEYTVFFPLLSLRLFTLFSLFISFAQSLSSPAFRDMREVCRENGEESGGI